MDQDGAFAWGAHVRLRRFVRCVRRGCFRTVALVTQERVESWLVPAMMWELHVHDAQLELEISSSGHHSRGLQLFPSTSSTDTYRGWGRLGMLAERVVQEHMQRTGRRSHPCVNSLLQVRRTVSASDLWGKIWSQIGVSDWLVGRSSIRPPARRRGHCSFDFDPCCLLLSTLILLIYWCLFSRATLSTILISYATLDGARSIQS